MNWNGIKELVEKNGYVLTLPMEQLRDAHGVAKLGVHVRRQISSELAGLGLGHVPEELPRYQHKQVRLYKKGAPAGEFIASVLTPGQQNDAKIVENFSGSGIDYSGIVEGIQEPRPVNKKPKESKNRRKRARGTKGGAQVMYNTFDKTGAKVHKAELIFEIIKANVGEASAASYVSWAKRPKMGRANQGKNPFGFVIEEYVEERGELEGQKMLRRVS